MRIYALLFVALYLLIGYARSTTLHDLSGRTMEIHQPVKTVFLLDSRDIIALDVAGGENAINKIIGWSGSLRVFASDIYAEYVKKYPKLVTLPTFGKTGADINPEEIIKIKPDVVIATMWSYAILSQNGTLDRLSSAGIDVIFIDFKYNNPENSITSIDLLGEIFNSKDRTNSFNKFYSEKLHIIHTAISAIHHNKTVLLEKHAGKYSDGDCCILYGTTGMGKLAMLAGGDNQAAGLVMPNGGKVSIETIMKLQPDYYVITGSDLHNYDKRSSSVPLGYQAISDEVKHQLHEIINRKGIAMLNAVKKGQVMVVYHNFYDDPLNIIIIEVLAKFLHPDAFANINPQQDLQFIHKKFMSIPAKGIFWMKSIPKQ